jgi:plastocyanin
MSRQNFWGPLVKVFFDRQLAKYVSIAVISSLTIILFASPLTNNSAYSQTIDKSNSNAGDALTSVAVPDAKSVFNIGMLSLPPTVKGFIIYIPDEAHHPPSDNKTISPSNANYIPTNLVIPTGTSIAFVHGDPNHIHVEILKDNKTRQVVWQTTPVTHPGASDVKVLNPGSYGISDKKYSNMKGTITVNSNKQSNGDLTLGGFFVPTSSLSKYKTDFASAGFQVLSTFNFLSKTVQKDISGPTTLMIYSTHLPIQDAIAKLKPLIVSLPYR